MKICGDPSDKYDHLTNPLYIPIYIQNDFLITIIDYGVVDHGKLTHQ